MKVVEILEWGKNTLKDHIDPEFKDFASPALDAEVLLAHALKMTKPKLFARLNYDVAPDKESRFQEYIERRLNHEPVAYITGKKYFYNRAFEVNSDVLIPRPDTEVLVEEAIKLYEMYSSSGERPLLIDIGIGSGAIALTIAAETHQKVLGTDISEKAVEIANRNAKEFGVDDQVTLRVGSMIEPILKDIEEREPHHTIITANLPYLTTNQWEDAQPELKEYEPKLALEAGYYGLDAYWLLFRQLAQYRKQLGSSCVVLIEIDPSQDLKIQPLVSEAFPKHKLDILPDLSGKPRVVRIFI